MTIPQWLDWAQRLQSIAQTGLHYNPQPFDKQRYEMMLDLAAEMMAAGSAENISPETLKTVFLEQSGHATPKVDVRSAVFREDRILLVQEKMDNNRWTLPGGWADIGESASESAVREAWEESGYHIRTLKLMAAYDRNKHPHPPFAFHAYKLFFLAELTDNERDIDPDNIEINGVDWFAEDALPELSVARVTPQQIARFFEHYRNPDLPTDFD
jgi:ADP-ribose pyrophosphatase YjhB (NUDIX family)